LTTPKLVISTTTAMAERAASPPRRATRSAGKLPPNAPDPEAIRKMVRFEEIKLYNRL
jgi:hypothetical protein